MLSGMHKPFQWAISQDVQCKIGWFTVFPLEIQTQETFPLQKFGACVIFFSGIRVERIIFVGKKPGIKSRAQFYQELESEIQPP